MNCIYRTKILIAMKLTLLLLVSFNIGVQASGYGQKVNLNVRNAALEEVFEKINKQTNYRFLYASQIVRKNALPVTVVLKNENINDALREVFKNQNLAYEIIAGTINVKEKTKIPTDYETKLEDKQLQQQISGVVKDPTGTALIGVTVTVKGTNRGTNTNNSGLFTITASPNEVLVFSSVGFTGQEVQLGNQNSLNIVLTPEQESIDEVVVVGYGTQKKINLTGSVSTVGGDVLTKRPVVNAVTMLQGLVPGLSVVQSSGQPGQGNVSIQIRGKGTFSGAGSNPLILVDGVPGNMESLDPNTIESVSVLKDAASASIYGSRGANGVILVTTKSGGNGDGKIHVDYNLNYGISSPTRLLDLVTYSPDYMKAWNTRIKNSNYGVDIPSRQYPQEEIDKYINPSDPILYPSFDWVDYIVNPAPTLMQNLSINGGKQTRYNLSIGYTDQKGTMEAFNYKRYNAQLNLVSTVSDRLKIGSNIQLKHGHTIADAQGQTNYFLVTHAQPPTLRPTLPDGSGRYSWRAYPFEENNWNPYQQLKEHGTTTNDYALNAQLWADFEIVKDLHWYAKAATNYGTSQFTGFTGNSDYLRLYRDPSVLGYQYTTYLDKSTTQDVYTNIYSYLTYDKKIDAHNFNAMVGYSNEENKYSIIGGYRNNYASPTTPELNAGSPNGQTNRGTSNAWAIESGFGRLSYNYDGKYLLEANVRYDGTSRLSPKTRWGAFPSVSGAWRLSEEGFMKNSKTWLSEAKIRVSWGKLGNQNIGLYPYQAMLNYTGDYPFDNANISQGVAQTALNNEHITWETTTSSDIGLDLTLFNKLNLTFDVYKKVTTDILRAAQVTGVVGLGAPTINGGSMQNTGFDLDLKYRDSVKDGFFTDLNFGFGGVLSAYKNKLIKFGALQDNGRTLLEEGRPWETFYLLQADGIFQSVEEIKNSPKQFGENTQPGMLKYKDTNGDNIIDNKDRVPMEKGVFPAFTYGLNFNADWKGFDVYGFFQGVSGSRVYVTGWGVQPFVQGSAPTKEQFKNAWTPENRSTTTVMLGDPLSYTHPSTYLLQNNSYLRLKTLQFGYSFSNELLKKWRMNKIRVYVSADNLVTFTKYPGLDPERTGSGTFISYPQNRVISFGLNVSL